MQSFSPNVICRQSKDEKVNSNGEKFLELCNDFQFSILNGCTPGDFDGNITYIRGDSHSVIDYVAAGPAAKSNFTKLEVLSDRHSDHFPLSSHFDLINPSNAPNNTLLPKLRWRKNKIVEYQNNTTSQLQSNHIVSLVDLDNFIFDLASSQSEPVNAFKAKNAWFDKECSNLRKQSFSFLNLFRKHNSLIFKQKYLEA